MTQSRQFCILTCIKSPWTSRSAFGNFQRNHIKCIFYFSSFCFLLCCADGLMVFCKSFESRFIKIHEELSMAQPWSPLIVMSLNETMNNCVQCLITIASAGEQSDAIQQCCIQQKRKVIKGRGRHNDETHVTHFFTALSSVVFCVFFFAYMRLQFVVDCLVSSICLFDKYLMGSKRDVHAVKDDEVMETFRKLFYPNSVRHLSPGATRNRRGEESSPGI